LNSGNTFSATLGLFGQVGIGISEPNSALKLGVTGKIGAQEYCDENGQNCSTPPFGAGGGGSCSNTPAQSTMTGNTVYTNNTSNKLIVVAFASAHDAQEDIEGWLKLSGGSWGLVTSDSSGTSATGARRDVAFVVPPSAQYKVVYEGGSLTGQSWEICSGGIGAGGLGYGQVWHNATAQRALGVTYINDTGKPIMISMSTYAYVSDSCVASFTVNGVPNIGAQFQNKTPDTGSSECSAAAIVPQGSTYKGVGQRTLVSWTEMH